MRTFFALICSFALALTASGAQENTKEKKPDPKKPAQATHGAQSRGGVTKTGGPHQHASQHGLKSPQAASPGKAKGKEKGNTSEDRENRPAQVSKEKSFRQHKANPTHTANADEAGREKAKDQQVRKAKSPEAGKSEASGIAGAKPVKPQHFNVPKQPNTAKAPAVRFQQGKRIEGSQNWQGERYAVFRNYQEEWHDKNWWNNHHNRIVFVFGAPYYWNAGYWFPAWGYSPNAYYAWSGPIYAFNNLPPDQVIANVQAALQEQGYYHGDVDGLIGPLTRDTIADYQRDHGLYMTSAIDEPTLQSLGMA